ncbi:hemolysin family protein [Undibacterium sp.]|uniref:hemolysin family protein n=1 Tax=Undibacterium sp. TaxID=1914977 RepID=UPI0037517DAF
MDNFLYIVAAIFLVLLNGFFVAAEFGLVKLRATRVRSLAKVGGFRGRFLIAVHQNLDAYLSACQLGITLASLGLGWVGKPAFEKLLDPLLLAVGIDSIEWMDRISLLFAFFVISFLHIVVGELAPKSMAIRTPERVSLWTAPALYLFYWVMFPAIWVLNKSSNTLLSWLGLDASHGSDSHYSPEELKMILRGSHASKKLTPDEWSIMAQMLDFGDLEISDLMRPINEVVAMYKDVSLEENMATAARNRFSRYPYIDSDGETVLGMLHLKDLFLAQQSGKSLDDLSKHLRHVEYVPPNTPALELFRRFRKGAPHFAMVGYRESKPVGFLTLDNLLSALVGQIRDEFRQNDNDWTLLDDGTLIGKGSLPLFTLGIALGIDLDNEEVESIGGLIMQVLGDLPEEGQKIEFSQFDVVVKKMNGPRIILVRIHPKAGEQSDAHKALH